MKENISGFPGYHITKDGKVYTSLVRGSKERIGEWYLKKTTFNRHGYEQTILIDSNKVHRCKLIHRLVAEAYIPNPNNLPVVMHKDDSPKNNHVSNLKWGTHKDNTWDSIIKGRNSYPPYGKGLNHPGSLLAYKPRLQRRIIRLYNKGLSYKAIGLRVNLGPKVISRFVSIRNSLD